MNIVVIIGANGHGKVVLDILLAAKQQAIIGFIDSNASLHGRRVDGLPVLGDLTLLPELTAKGHSRRDHRHRRQQHPPPLRATGRGHGLDLINAIHPSAQIAHNAVLGRNAVIAAGVVVCAHTQIGDSGILNTGSIVDHESMIGTAAHICPGARLAGHDTAESGAFVGIGSTIVENVRIGFEAVVGPGAVVLRDVLSMTTVVGVPAEEIKSAPSANEFASLVMPSARAQ